MKRILAVGTALLLLSSTAAMAQPRDYGHDHGRNQAYGHNYGYAGYGQNYGYRGDYYRHDDGDAAGAAIAGGILGLALGAMAASNGPAYYAPAYPAPYGYAAP